MEAGKLLAAKLKSISTAASTANTEIEKAALFAAAQSILEYFRGDNEKWKPNTVAKVETAVWHIAAAVGYGPDNGHNRSQHIGWAYSAIDTVVHLLGNDQALEN